MFFQHRYREMERNVVVFTMHKAGSMLLHRVLKDICDQNDIRYHSENQPEPDRLPVRKIFRGKDYISKESGCFGPVRFFLPSRALPEANILLHLRDPRDVLTSMFYSYCFMHSGKVEPNTGVRREAAERGIDRYVLDMAGDGFRRYEGDYGTGGNFKDEIGNVLERYERYLRELIGRPNVVLVSYEEMVRDFAGWLRKVVDRFELQDNEATYRMVLAKRAEEVAPVTEENIWLHKRKVTPGDYREKLKPETIAELDRRFGPVLETLGYARAERPADVAPGR